MKASQLAAVLLLAVTTVADAQSAPTPASSVVLRFHVVNEQRNPVADAAIDLHDSSAAHLSLRTNADGRQATRVPRTEARYSYTIRMIGYAELTGTLVLSRGDSTNVEAMLRRSVQSLDAVRTDARANERSYSITADQIARSGRNDPDAYDVLRAMRPNMIGSRLNCGYVQTLWVNGQRVLLAPWEAVIPMQSRQVQFPMPHSPPNSPLSLIKPEHILEMRYVDCWDRTVPNRAYYHNAIYVTLKAGIGFDVRKGTYVADSASARSAGVIP